MLRLRNARGTRHQRSWDLAAALSPRLAFPVVWILGVAIAQIHLLHIQRPWSGLTWVAVTIVPVAVWLGGGIGEEIARARTWTQQRLAIPAVGRSRLRRVLSVFVVLGYLEEVHQWIGARAVPLLATNADAARFRQPGGPTIILTDLLTVAAIASLVTPRKLISKDAAIELGIAAVAISAFVLAGGRGTVILPVVAASVARIFFWGRLRVRVLVAILLLAALMASASFYYRTSQHRERPFEHELYYEVLPRTPAIAHPFIPLEIGIAMNFEAFARIVDYFPREAPYGYGSYDLLGFDLFVPQARDLAPITARLSSPWVTSTVAGPFFADGGLVGVILGMVLIGMVSSTAYMYSQRTHELRHALIAGYLVYLTIFGFYTNLWTQEVDWLLVAPLLYVCGSVAQGLRPIPGSFGVLASQRFPKWLAASTTPHPTSNETPYRKVRGLRLGALALGITGLLVGTGSFEATRRIAHPRQVSGDYNGDGRTDIAIFRPSDGTWRVLGVAGAVRWGVQGDVPVPGDYTGDGRTDIAVFRPSNSTWYISANATAVRWGVRGDVPVPGDYNGDGRTDIAVFRPSNSTWYISANAGAIHYGANGDFPLAALSNQLLQRG